MTGRHAHPWTVAATLVDGYHPPYARPGSPRRRLSVLDSPLGPRSDRGFTGVTTAALPPQRSPEASAGVGADAAGSPTPQLQVQWATPASYFPGGRAVPGSDVGVVSDGVVDEGAAPHSLIRRAAPASFVRTPDTYDDNRDVDEGDSWADLVNGVRAPICAAAHVNAIPRGEFS